MMSLRPWLVVGLLLALQACADRTPGRFAPRLAPNQIEELIVMRSWLTLVIAVQYAFMLYSTKKLDDKQSFARLVAMAFFLGLSFTRIGEWLYRFTAWVLGWGLAGKGMLVFGALGGGMSGVGNMMMMLLAGYLFPDPEVLNFTVVPSLVTGAGTNFAFFLKARGQMTWRA